MKNSKLWLVVLAVCLLTLALAACGADTAATDDQTDATEQTEAAADGQKTIGMVVKYASIEYIQAFIIGAQQTCDELGYKLLVTDAEADTQKILNAIDNFMTQGIDGFILAGAEDLVSLVPGIEKLNEAGIPVMALDTCPEGGHVDMFLTFDIEDSSRKAAEQMIEGIKGAHGGEVPAGKIIEITGSLVDMFTTECHEGFMSVIEQYPQLEVVQGEGHWNNDDSYSRTADLLTAHGDDVVGIYVHTPDIMGSGTVAAVEAAGLNPADYFISGICIGMEGRDLLQQGKLYAVVEQPALDSAIMAVRYMGDLFEGKALPAVGDTVEEDGALWSPAQVLDNEYADSGLTMILQGPLCPQEVAPDSELLWENRVQQ
ncbi:MAG: sugar ABC transporter substrate-binding protein [Firmicutes bacterium]|nr:sugar ABC transporter substrate-binding protein [Bacillota bacterium]